MRALTVAIVLLAGCEGEELLGTPLGVELEDGQIIVGAVQTDVLLLDGAHGRLAVPLDDVGAVFPAEGNHLADGQGGVTVWLRNGSELRGEWAEPELSMGLAVGGDTVPIDMPVEAITGVQTRGQPVWPEVEVFRVRTTWGDDFLVDAHASRLVLVNELGTFAPFLSECVRAEPVGDPTGDWRLELVGGTTLIGPLADGAVTFALPMGPASVTVALSDFVSVERQTWGYATPEAAPMEPVVMAEEALSAADTGTPKAAAGGLPAVPAKVRYRKPALSSGAGWFDQRGLELEKSKY